MNGKKVLMIIPAYNEEGSILKVYNSIMEYNKKHKVKLDVIVINDESTDNTRKILEDNDIPHINLIQNLGIGGAVQTGYKYAYNNGYDIAVQFDGDNQHDIEYIEDILYPIIVQRADMVIGSRFIESEKDNFKSTKMRRFGIKIITGAIELVTHKKIKDPTSGYRACNRSIIELFSVDYPAEYPEPITEVRLLRRGFVIEEVYSKMKERETGVSSINMKFWRPAYYMFNVIISILVEGVSRKK